MPFGYYRRIAFVASTAILVAMVATYFFPAPIDYSGLPINGTDQPTKIAAQTVPTVVNGITTMTSIVVAFGGVLCGTIVFREIAKDDPRSKSKYFEMLGMFILPALYLWVSYIFLGLGWFEWAIRWALSGFLVALLMFILFYLFILGKLRSDEERKSEQEKPEKDKSKPIERDETTGQGEAERDGNKNVNVFVNVN